MSFTKSALAAIDGRCVAHHCKTIVGCAKTIVKKGASFSLAGAPTPHLLADFDKPPLYHANKKRCDFLFVADAKNGGGNGWLALIEMTSGKKSAGEASRQLRAGAESADGAIPLDFKIKFRVALVGGMSKRERRNLDKPGYRVKFRDCGPQTVRVIRDNGKLADALTGD